MSRSNYITAQKYIISMAGVHGQKECSEYLSGSKIVAVGRKCKTPFHMLQPPALQELRFQLIPSHPCKRIFLNTGTISHGIVFY